MAFDGELPIEDRTGQRHCARRLSVIYPKQIQAFRSGIPPDARLPTEPRDSQASGVSPRKAKLSSNGQLVAEVPPMLTNTNFDSFQDRVVAFVVPPMVAAVDWIRVIDAYVYL